MNYAIQVAILHPSTGIRKDIEKEMRLLQNEDSVSWLTVMEVSMETGALLGSKFGTQRESRICTGGIEAYRYI